MSHCIVEKSRMLTYENDSHNISNWCTHALSIGVGLVAWWALGRFFQGKSWRPRLDAFTTVGSLVATYWMLQFVHANWLYWIVVNAVSIVLYASRGLRWGTGLFVLYTLLALEGWFNFIPQL